MSVKLGNNLEMNKLQILNGVFHLLTTAPSGPVIGQFYYNTTDKVLMIYDGATWVPAGSGDIPDLIIENIAGLQSALDAKVDSSRVLTDVPDGALFTDTIATRESLGIENVDNTTDLNKPISTATESALALKESITNVDTKVAAAEAAAKLYADGQLTDLVGGAPEALDTLLELSAALGDDPNFAATMTLALAKKTGKYKQTIGDGETTIFTITHGLGTRDVVAQVRLAGGSQAIVLVDVEMTTDDTATVIFATPPAASEYIVTVIG